MPPLDREKILKAEDRPTITVEVPQWGGSVTIKKLSAWQKDVLESFWRFDEAGKFITDSAKNDRARLACLSIVDDVGNPMFGIDDALVMADKSADAVAVIAEAARVFNGLGNKDAALKNSPETTGDSGS